MRRIDICRHAFIESAMAIPSKMPHALVGPAFGVSRGLIANRRFAALQFRSLYIKPELFEDYYRDSRVISKRDMIAFMKANTGYALKESSGAAGLRRACSSAERSPGASGVPRRLCENICRTGP